MGKRIALLAGAAMGLTAGAQAQTDVDRAYSAEMLADAKSHTSTLAQPPATAVNVGGQVQFRWNFNSRDDAGLVEDTTIGFQTRRTKIWVFGDVNEEFSYKVQGAFDRDGGSFILQDAYVDYKVNDQSTLRWGQFKLPFLREELVSSAKQLAAERSIVNETFNQDWSQGVQWTYGGENFRVMAAFSDGVRTANTDFDSASEADFGFTGRFEYMWSGDWKQFDDFTSWKGSPFAGMVGGAVHWESGGNTHAAPNTTTPDTDTLGLTVDLSVEGDSWNAYGAIVWVSTDPATGGDRDDLGFVAQGGYAFTDNWEVFGRFDMVIPEDPTGAPEEDFSTLTAGVNYYVIPQSHAAKLTADLSYFLDEQALSIVPASTGTGLLPSGEDGQFAVRLQFQVLF